IRQINLSNMDMLLVNAMKPRAHIVAHHAHSDSYESHHMACTGQQDKDLTTSMFILVFEVVVRLVDFLALFTYQEVMSMPGKGINTVQHNPPYAVVKVIYN